MKNVTQIREIEEKYKQLLINGLKGDKRITLTSSGKYPEPAFVYIKSVKTDKTIAVRLDGEDGTMRFWDYVDDDYTKEDGVWAKMTESGLETMLSKLKSAMQYAYDIEYFESDGECEEYYSSLFGGEVDETTACKLTKKYGKEVPFVFAKFSTFLGDKQYVFDKLFRLVKR